MNKIFTKLFIILIPIISNQLVGQENFRETIKEVIKKSLDLAIMQHKLLAISLKDSASLLPKAADRNGKLIPCNPSW